MRTALFGSALFIIAALGCTRGGGGIAREPLSPTSSGAAVITHAEPAALDENDRKQPVYNAQKGFEDRLPAPDADGSRATGSDVGKPRWHGSLGTFIEDPNRYPQKQRRSELRDETSPEADRGLHERE